MAQIPSRMEEEVPLHNRIVWTRSPTWTGGPHERFNQGLSEGDIFAQIAQQAQQDAAAETTARAGAFPSGLDT